MRRREFTTLLGGTAAGWPLSARAQQAAMPVIGLLHPLSPDTYAERLHAFHGGLKESGCVEGENVTIVYRWAGGQTDHLRALADELVSRHISVIAAFGPAAFAAKAATTTIPIVFLINVEIATLARPGGNLTGISLVAGKLEARRLELLHGLVPAATRVAVLVNPVYAPASAETTVRNVEAAARTIGLQIQVLKASTSREINAAFATFVRDRPDALLVDFDPFFISRRVQLVNLIAPRDSRHISGAPIYRSRRAHKLRDQYYGCVASGRRLCRPHRQGRQPSGPARAGEQVRAVHQHANRHDARPHSAAAAAHYRRWGDRVIDFPGTLLLHLLTAGIGTRPRYGHVRDDGES